MRVYILLTILASSYFAMATEDSENEQYLGGCSFPAPVGCPYRSEPEEETVALAALTHYLGTRSQLPSEALCVTLPDDRPPNKKMRKALSSTGIKVDRNERCSLEYRRIVLGVVGVWRITPTEFVAHVSKWEADDISLFLEEYEYTLQYIDGAWRVVTARPSPCNPSQQATDAPASDKR